MLWNALVLSISMSIDALGIGISYHMQKVRIPWKAKITIGMVSSVVMWLSLNIGSLLITVFPPSVMKIVGVVVLLIIGISFIKNSIFGTEKATYDIDKSSNIELWEAVLLGLVLSADSVSAGIATAAMGLRSMMIPITVGIIQTLFLWMGGWIVTNSSISIKINQKVCGVFSGSLLILIAILRGIG